MREAAGSGYGTTYPIDGRLLPGGTLSGTLPVHDGYLGKPYCFAMEGLEVGRYTVSFSTGGIDSIHTFWRRPNNPNLDDVWLLTVLTEGNIRALVKVVDEQMDGVAREQRKRLETIEDELEDVKRKLGRIWHFVETTDIDMADASDRIKEHRERQERLEDAAADARAILSQRRAVLDDVNTIAAYAQDMSEFLNESELTERRAFIETFVKEIVVMPGDALLRYTIPMPDDSPIPGRKAEEMALNGSVLSTVKNGGAGENLFRVSGGCSLSLGVAYIRR